jgi:hypothetical protein
LETELNVQSKENRELLKLKIGLLREQVEAERNHSASLSRVTFN